MSNRSMKNASQAPMTALRLRAWVCEAATLRSPTAVVMVVSFSQGWDGSACAGAWHDLRGIGRVGSTLRAPGLLERPLHIGADGRPGLFRLGDGPEQPQEAVGHGRVVQHGDRNAGPTKPVGVLEAFVTQRVVLDDQQHGRGQAGAVRLS